MWVRQLEGRVQAGPPDPKGPELAGADQAWAAGTGGQTALLGACLPVSSCRCPRPRCVLRGVGFEAHPGRGPMHNAVFTWGGLPAPRLPPPLPLPDG